MAGWGTAGNDAGQFRFRGPDRCDDSLACVPDAGGAIAVDALGHVYVADYANHRIQTFDEHGHLLAKWGHEGDQPGEFRLPNGVAVDGRGRVYVSDAENHRVQVFDANGQFLAKWGGRGVSDGRFFRPGALAVAADGDVYVADQRNSRVQRFDNAGRFRSAWSVGGNPGAEPRAAGLAIGHVKDVYVAAAPNGILRFSPDQQPAELGNGPGDAPRWRPSGLAVDAAGDVYVAEPASRRVVRLRLLAPVTG